MEQRASAVIDIAQGEELTRNLDVVSSTKNKTLIMQLHRYFSLRRHSDFN